MIRLACFFALIAIAALVTFVGYFLFNSGYYEWWGGAGMGAPG